MMYDLGNMSSRKQSPYISYGSGHILRINKIELIKSQSTDSLKGVLHMETKPITDSNFEPIEGAEGKVGKIGLGVYMKHDRQKIEFLEKLREMAAALGAEDEVSKIKGDSFEKVVGEIEKVLIGNKYARYTIFAEEYSKSNGSTGVRLIFPRWNFVESLDVVESKLTQFDPNNSQHLKKIKRVETLGENIEDDLPF